MFATFCGPRTCKHRISQVINFDGTFSLTFLEQTTLTWTRAERKKMLTEVVRCLRLNHWRWPNMAIVCVHKKSSHFVPSDRDSNGFYNFNFCSLFVYSFTLVSQHAHFGMALGRNNIANNVTSHKARDFYFDWIDWLARNAYHFFVSSQSTHNKIRIINQLPPLLCRCRRRKSFAFDNWLK